ncbi:tyrosyl-DNA phosphodiesterase 2 [Marchantia polymorpha subsp. ruderalis]|uniref:Endonuclease/exonuclease/phosphatase domain-containing protein n=2 Tax=Marchantia polymorpha TaxID=3197 RepID=A0AAF6BVX3_MARPO|nr:hypothetical protein MARPO_0074s0008 [Marchantia polymorpha]BBN16157.1 hypothetical protein Mp_7g03910 [Marchantia polymorpha subsp. ruderalis]|eukprot:PTQ35010.1 hypothetical protein MARPO_0074s0008 [Marchantia polymorpha]
MGRGSEKSAPPVQQTTTDTIYLELQSKINAIGNIILQHQPHVICFQVTTNIYSIFQKLMETLSVRVSVSYHMIRLPFQNFHRNPFDNSVMGRELCMADMDDESPCHAPPTWNQMYSKEQVTQANEALNFMKDMPNVVFGGDMTNSERLTYDSKATLMLSGSRLQKRIDRFFFHLQNFKVDSLEMVGTQPIPGLTYQKERTVMREVQMQTLPVYPSDHFGLLLKLQRLQP